MGVIIKTPLFWVIFHQNRRIWPPAVYTNVVDWYLYWIHFIRLVFKFVSNGFLCMFGIFQGVKIVKNRFFCFFFDKILEFNPPWCSENWLLPGCFVLYYTHFKNNFDFSWFFMIILVKKPKNVKILAKMRKFKFFHNFKTAHCQFLYYLFCILVFSFWCNGRDFTLFFITFFQGYTFSLSACVD